MRPRNMAKVFCLLLLVTGLSIGDDRNNLRDREDRDEAAKYRTVSVADCTFEQNPDRYRDGFRRAVEEISTRTERFTRQRTLTAPARDSREEQAALSNYVPHRNYIDDYIFDRMERDSIPHSPLCTDAEFIRRVTLDLTGRVPDPADVRTFLENDEPKKRSNLIDSLGGSPEFVDKWTVFFGDLLQNTQNDSYVNRYVEGRNAFYKSIKSFLDEAMPYDVFAKKILTGSGNTDTVGEAGWIVGTRTPMGPVQDSYDTALARAATQFLGLSNFDCLLCHSGAGHLDKLNLWATAIKRSEAWEMAAFFSRASYRATVTTTTPVTSYWTVTELTTGDYTLNTTSGNRTARQASGGSNIVKPRYVFSTTQEKGSTYREQFANNLIKDRQFARATVNYLWKEIMGTGIVEPADQFDLKRIDPTNPPPSTWTIQPSNSELLEALTDDFIASGYDVQHFLKTIADSSTYQLSSRFSGEWKETYSTYYARKFVRRLWAEEVHDAIATATGVKGSYTITGFTTAIEWAMKLPGIEEPSNNRDGALNLMRFFLRGNRDVNLRSDDGTILQALNMMNNTFVTARIKNSNRNTTVYKLLSTKEYSNERVIDELYLSTLGRFPSEKEKTASLVAFKANRITGAENLQWALLNKIDFLYNY